MDANDVQRVLITETLHPADPGQHMPEFDAARKKELEGLIRWGTWKVFAKEDVPEVANVLGGRFVLAKKDVETDKPVNKARFVVQGHRDKEKCELVNDAATMRQTSIRVVIALAAIFGFRVWSHDISQAYLQSASKLMREVYLKPTKDFELSPDELLQLLIPLYGLPDSADYWHDTFTRHIQDDLGMQKLVGDMATFVKHIRGRLAGMAGTYVDDYLMAGDEEYRKLTDRMLDKFESRERSVDNFTFAGIEVQALKDGFLLHQKKQADRLKILPSDASYRDFKSKEMQLAWLCHTRPEIFCAVAQAAQVTEKYFDSACIKQLNRSTKAVKENPGSGIRHCKLDLSTLRLQVYTDSSFANNLDSPSQLGYIVLLCDSDERCNVLQYHSFKSKRVTRSVLGAEVYAFAEGFDAAFILKHDLEKVLRRQILMLAMLTDSKTLFDIITKNSVTTERRLMIDLLAAKQAYDRMEISDIGWIRTEYNPADAFTKVGRCAALEAILDQGIVNHPVECWVVRRTQQRVE